MASNRGGRRPAGRGRVAGARKRPAAAGTPVPQQEKSSDLPPADDRADGDELSSAGDSTAEVGSAAGEEQAPAPAAMSASAAGAGSDDRAGDEASSHDVVDDDDLDGFADDDDDDDDDDDLDDDDDDLDGVADELDDDLDNDDLDDDDVDDDEVVEEADDDDTDGTPVAAAVSGRRARAAAERAAAEKKAPPNKKDASKPGTKPARISDPASTKKTGAAKPRAAASTGNRRSLMRFLREVIAELGKVVWPGRRELIIYTSVVLVFMIFMVSLVAGLDILFAQGVLAVFG